MLKGLEVSEVRFSGLNDEHRIDAECYRKSFLQFEKAICAKKYTTVGDVARFLIGPFGSAFDTANYIENGKYRYVRGQDVKPFILKDDDCRYVPEADEELLSVSEGGETEESDASENREEESAGMAGAETAADQAGKADTEDPAELL